MLKKTQPDTERLNRVVAEAQRNRQQREQSYRNHALQLYPWVCNHCGREFTRENLHELTVHHKDHDHDNNPPDGSNWELLCLYCHDNEHARYVVATGHSAAPPDSQEEPPATYKPFADLKALLKNKV